MNTLQSVLEYLHTNGDSIPEAYIEGEKIIVPAMLEEGTEGVFEESCPRLTITVDGDGKITVNSLEYGDYSTSYRELVVRYIYEL